MNRIERRIRRAVNPVSSGATRWWCQSAIRHVLTGYGPAAGQRRLMRRGIRGSGFTPSAGQGKAYVAAAGELAGRDDHEMRA